MARIAGVDVPREKRNSLQAPRLSTEEFGVFAEKFARFMGTAKFLIWMTIFVILWLGWNTLAPKEMRFDPYSFTFLTLILSLQASYAAPLILLAQNRQENRDRVSLEEDRRRAEQTKADTEYLARELAALRLAVGEVATRDYLRRELEELREMITDLHQSVVPPADEDAAEAGKLDRRSK